MRRFVKIWQHEAYEKFDRKGEYSIVEAESVEDVLRGDTRTYGQLLIVPLDYAVAVDITQSYNSISEPEFYPAVAPYRADGHE